MNKEYTNKYFGEALRELLVKRKYTYRKFVILSGVSKTYLTKILVHNFTPSEDIILKIARALRINPNFFREYRIIQIIKKLEKYFLIISDSDFNELEEFIKKIEIKIEDDKTILKKDRKINFNFVPEYLLNIDKLDETQRRIINILKEQFEKSNIEAIKYFKKEEEQSVELLNRFKEVYQAILIKEHAMDSKLLESFNNLTKPEREEIINKREKSFKKFIKSFDLEIKSKIQS